MKKYIALIFILVVGLFVSPQSVYAANTHSADFEKSSSQYLSITDGSQTNLDLNSNFTIEAWINLESQPGEYCMASKYNSSGNQRAYYFCYGDDGGQKSLRVAVSSSGVSAGEIRKNVSTLTLGTWYHVVVAYDLSAGQAEWWVDGTSQGTTSGGSTSIHNSTADFTIGTKVSGDSHFDGLIDEVRVWNDLRTNTEINDNKDTELDGTEAGLVGYWKLNNGLLDETSNNNDLTNNNSVVFSTDVPFSGGAADTCSYGGSGNWDVLYSDNCYIASEVYVHGEFNLIASSTGSFASEAIISATRINVGNTEEVVIDCKGETFCLVGHQ